MPRKDHLFVGVVAAHPLAAEYLLQLLSKDQRIAGCPAGELVRKTDAEAVSPIFVLDKNGLSRPLSDCLRSLRIRFTTAKFIVLDENEPAQDIVRLLWLGIHGFLHYPDVKKELIPAIHALAVGRMWVPSVAMELYVQQAIPNRRVVHGVLTPRENQILELVRRRLSNKEIAEILKVRESTVKYHLTSIFSKVRVSSRYELHDQVGRWDNLAKILADAGIPGD